MKANLALIVVGSGMLLWMTGCVKKPASSSASAPPSATSASLAGQPVRQPTVTWSDYAVPAEPPASSELLVQGKKLFADNCAACHGIHGDGKGQCSNDLIPRPRDFTQGHFRLRTTASGMPPLDSDLYRTISLGMNGTPMPPWGTRLSPKERWALVDYIKTFSKRFSFVKESQSHRVKLGIPPPRTPAAIAQGKAIYGKMGCANCHGANGQGDGPSAYSLTDDTGSLIAARDFTKPRTFVAGYAAKEIVRGFLTGFDGTPMPSFAGAIAKSDAWKLAYYVQTFAKKRVVPVEPAPHGSLVHEKLGKPEVVIHLTERGWKFEPDQIHVRKNQVVEVIFEPTDNGLGAGHGFAISGYDDVAFINGAMVGRPKEVKFRANRAGKFKFYCATQCSVGKLHPNMMGTFYVDGDSPAQTASLH